MRGSVLYEPMWTGEICFQSDSSYQTYVLSLFSSNMTDGPRRQPFKIEEVQWYQQEVHFTTRHMVYIYLL